MWSLLTAMIFAELMGVTTGSIYFASIETGLWRGRYQKTSSVEMNIMRSQKKSAVQYVDGKQVKRMLTTCKPPMQAIQTSKTTATGD